jgi:arabinofuranosyltransferase
LIPGVVLVAYLSAVPTMGWSKSWRHYRGVGLAFALVQIGLIAFRLLYFGDPVPNTYFAKVSGDFFHQWGDGFEYLTTYIAAQPEVGLCLIAALGCLARYGARLLFRAGNRGLTPGERGIFIVSGVLVAGLSMPMLTGGDHFGSHRYFQPYALLMILPPAHLLCEFLSSRDAGWTAQRRGALCLVAVLVIAGFGATSWLRFQEGNGLWHEFSIARHGIATGQAIALAFPEEESVTIGVVAAGGMAFAHRGRTLDLLGLNWRAMAHAPVERLGLRGHSAFNTRLFWTQPPELMTPSLLRREPRSATDMMLPFKSEVLHYIFSKARFRRAYVPGAIETDKGWVSGFFLRSWLASSGTDKAIVRVPW